MRRAAGQSARRSIAIALGLIAIVGICVALWLREQANEPTAPPRDDGLGERPRAAVATDVGETSARTDGTTTEAASPTKPPAVDAPRGAAKHDVAVLTGSVTNVEGHPIAGASVAASFGSRGIVECRTDGRGIYSLSVDRALVTSGGTALGSDRLIVAAVAEGYGKQVLPWSDARGALDFVLERACRLRIAVTEEGSGAPCPRCEISLSRVGTRVLRAIRHERADESGVLDLPDLRPGSYDVTVKSAGGHAPASVRVVAESGFRRVSIRLRLGLVLQGVVIDADAKRPVPNAAVVCWLNRERVLTADDGRFSIPGLPRVITAEDKRSDRHRLRVSAAGFLDRKVPFDLADGRVSSLSIELERAYTIRGIVVGPEGTPVPGASVREVIDDPDAASVRRRPERVTADVDGRFVLVGISARDCRVAAKAAGYVSSVVPLDEASVRGSEPITLRLGRGAALRGVVLDAAGAAVSDGRVVVSSRGEAVADRRTSTIGDDGRFEVTGLSAGVHDVTVTSPGFVPTTVEEVTVPAAAALRVTVNRGLRIEGVVRSPDGEPLAEVRLVGQAIENSFTGRANWFAAKTDRAGAFAVESTRDTAWLLTLEASDRYWDAPGPMVISGRDGPLAISADFYEPLSIRGRVSGGSAGSPAASFTVRLHSVDDRTTPTHRTTTFNAADGGFLLSGLPRGAYLLEAETADGWTTDGPVEVRLRPRQNTPHVDLSLRSPSRVIEGIVVDPDGAGTAAAVRVRRRFDGQGAFTREAEAGIDGRFRVAVPSGDYVVIASHPRWVSGCVACTVSASEPTSIRVGLHATGGRVAVKVRDVSGRPKVGVRVVIRTAEGTIVEVPMAKYRAAARSGDEGGAHRDRASVLALHVTDATGRWRRRFLAPGHYVVEAVGIGTARIQVIDGAETAATIVAR